MLGVHAFEWLKVPQLECQSCHKHKYHLLTIDSELDQLSALCSNRDIVVLPEFVKLSSTIYVTKQAYMEFGYMMTFGGKSVAFCASTWQHNYMSRAIELLSKKALFLHGQGDHNKLALLEGLIDAMNVCLSNRFVVCLTNCKHVALCSFASAKA